MVTFKKRVFVLGCGSVAQSTIPLLLNLLDILPANITIMDVVDNRKYIEALLIRGVHYTQERITKENFSTILAKQLSSGDLFIDLSVNIETSALLEWCHDRGVLYINTSVETWEDSAYKTVYDRQIQVRKLINRWHGIGTTAIVDHGTNPGLVSHFVKQGLIDLAKEILIKKPDDSRRKAFESAITQRNFAKLTYLTNTQVIHISERDSQIITKPKEPNEFVNSWSVKALVDEALLQGEIAWGSHEKKLPRGSIRHISNSENQIILPSRGMDILIKSWVPSGQIIGMAIPHGEVFGISDNLTLHDSQGSVIHRPTVCFAYCVSDAALCSLYELRMRDFVIQKKQRIMKNEILSGMDEVGVLLMGHDFTSWWTGSRLNIATARSFAPDQNGTTLQVAISVVACTIWAIKNPNHGICLPDTIDHEAILEIAKPYLGEYISKESDWMPQSGIQKKNMWQFSSFLVRS